jgi:hypothetical protein
MAHSYCTRAAIPLLCTIGLIGLAGLLAGCASNAPSAAIAAEVASGIEPFPFLHPQAVAPLVTKFEIMRSALPEFELLQQTSGNEVSVERNLGFEPQSPIISSDEVRRISLLQAYLLTDPSLTVGVEGYFKRDRAGTEEALALDRAQALVRALLTDMRIKNDVTAVAAPRLGNAAAQSAIIFIDANGLGQMQSPLRERAVKATQ